jgi:hypothetical protein
MRGTPAWLKHAHNGKAAAQQGDSCTGETEAEQQRRGGTVGGREALQTTPANLKQQQQGRDQGGAHEKRHRSAQQAADMEEAAREASRFLQKHLDPLGKSSQPNLEPRDSPLRHLSSPPPSPPSNWQVVGLAMAIRVLHTMLVRNDILSISYMYSYGRPW